MKSALVRFIRDEQGTSMIEYTVIGGSIAVLIVGALISIGQFTLSPFQTFNQAVSSVVGGDDGGGGNGEIGGGSSQ